MAEKDRTPLAIVLAGLFVGAGLFFGLRAGRSPDSPGPAAPPGGAGSPGPALPASRDNATPPASPANALPPPSREKAAQQAQEALEKHRPLLIEKCWKPFGHAPGRPKTASYLFNLTFDAQGSQVMRGIAESRETPHPEVTTCVTQTLPLLQIAPSGASIYVEVPFSLP